MCGISAVFKYTQITEHDKECLHKMNAEMKYRGPDEEGVWSNYRCGLAHTRLSVIGFANGHQPIFNEDKTLVLVCNGEIYNYKELTAQLQKQGHVFTTCSDSETIVHLYEEYGTSCLQYLRGMFAFCLFDAKKELLFAARDRIGEKTLYFANVQCGIVFSTELKTIVKYYIDKPQVNVRLLAESIRFGYPIELKQTYIEQVCRLLPGEYSIVDSKGIEFHSYWNRYCQPKYSGSIIDAKREILHLIQESVTNCLQSDVPVAVLLSGGVDSSAIVHFAKETGQEIHCICAGYSGQYDVDERFVAKNFSSKEGVIYHEVELGIDDFKDIFEEYICYIDEPVADLASIAQWALYKKAKALGFTVLLGGLGGDELFYGYPIHNECGEALQIRNKLETTVSRKEWLGIFLTNLEVLGPHKKIHLDDRWPVDWTFSSYNQFAKTSSLIINGETYNMGEYNVNYNYPIQSDINTVYDLQFSRFMTTQCLYLADRLGMGNSVELRSPLVDYKLVEFISSLPIEMKYFKGKPKQLLKNILTGIIPDNILKGPKRGFTPPSQFIKELCNKYQYKYFKSDYMYFNSILADKIISYILCDKKIV